MHGRPYVIALEAQNQLKQLFIRVKADGGLIHVGLGPVIQLFLIIDEDAAVLHRRIIRVLKALRKTDLLLFFHRHIGPVIPGGYPDPLTKFIHTVDGSPSIGADDPKPPITNLQQIGLLSQISLFIT